MTVVSCGAKTSAPAGSHSPSGRPGGTPSGVVGIVLFEGGPVIFSPSPLPDGFGSGAKGRPDRFVIVQIKATSGPNAGKVVARLKPNAEALFSVDLPPGRYILRPLVPKNGPWPRLTTITVRAGQRTRAVVYVEGL
jgi:hypothetical protein